MKWTTHTSRHTDSNGKKQLIFCISTRFFCNCGTGVDTCGASVDTSAGDGGAVVWSGWNRRVYETFSNV